MQFWNISNLAIKNASSVSNINNNLHYYVKLIFQQHIYFLNQEIHKITNY